MAKSSYPSPILDRREEKLLRSLTQDYLKFRTPGHVSKWIKRIGSGIRDITPRKFRQLSEDAVKAATETQVIKRALEAAGKGLGVAGNQSAKWLVSSPERVVKAFAKQKLPVEGYDGIAGLRSYDVARVAGQQNFQHQLLAFVEGGATGAPGLIGIPFNIALSFLLFFRATQSIAMQYGYDVRSIPAELETAAQVTLECLAPGTAEGEEGFAGLIAKMMAIGELSALNAALSKTYGTMVTKGGASLLYVQFRALANKAAQKALEKGGQRGLEAGIFKNLLEQAAKQLPKSTTQRFIPVLSAFIGAGVDTYVMNRILIGANLIYHKRFLLEKQDRLDDLKDRGFFAE